MIIRYIEEVESTNDCLKECREDRVLVCAFRQKKGRGQRGNSWESEDGKNLTFSFVLFPGHLAAEEQFRISKIVSIALVRLLAHYGITAQIKWPNDIYVGDKKIAGILIENTLSSSGMLSRSIVGIGLNVNQEHFVSDAPNPVSMRQLAATEFPREAVLEQFCEIFETLYQDTFGTATPQIDRLYWESLYRKECAALYCDSQGTFTGTIVGIGVCGELIVRKSGGEQCAYLFKEVSFVIG